MTELSTDLDGLLDRADSAVDRGDWAEVAVLAEAALALDPTSVEAMALASMASRRAAKADVVQDRSFDAERRTLTVMFCDLVGSTEMADRFDPEDTRAVLRWYHGFVGEVVERNGGFVAHYMGDGALVYFGWPTAMDDSALCAVRAALDLLHGVDEYRSSPELQMDAVIDLRVGIHTGLVVVGEMGAGRRRERNDVVGETPNIAARLESFAMPGTVVVSGETFALVQHRVDATPLGAQKLKGITRSIEVYRIDSVVDVATRYAIGRTRATIVGRDAEIAVLRDAIERARTTSSGEFFAIAGEPGIGKSRLLESALEGLDEREPRCTIVRAQCNPQLSSTPFHPILELIGHGAFGGHPLALNVDDDESRAQLIAGAAERLLAIDADGTVVVVVEDVHWADPSTLDVLQRVATDVINRRAVVIVTHRPEKVPEWLAACRRLELAALDRAGFDDLVAGLAEGRSLSSDLHERLFDRTGGVPLFVEELVSALLESDDRAESDDALIPNSLNDVLVARLDRCGSAKRTAQIASVIGRTVSTSLLAHMTRTADVTAHIDVLVRAGVFDPVQADVVRFRHALVQDAAYSTMLRSTARRMHELAAESIKALEPTTHRDAPEVLARHLRAAGNYREALDLYRAAATISIERSAPHETVAHLNGALACFASLVDGDDANVELGLLLDLGPALIAARGYGSEDVQHTYERAAKLCEDSPESVEAFGALLGLTAFFLVNEQLERAESLGLAMTDHAERSGQPDDMAEAAAWLGTVWFFQGRHVEALPKLQRAADHPLARDIRREGRAGLDPRVLALSHLTWMHLVRDEQDVAALRHAQMMNVAEGLDRAVSKAHAMTYSCGYALLTGRADDALRLAELARVLAMNAKLPHYVAYAQLLAGAANRWRDPAEAAESLRAGIRRRLEVGAQLAATFHYSLLAEAELIGGRIEAAREAVERARVRLVETGEGWWAPEIDRLDGEVQTAIGNRVAAEALFVRAVNRAVADGAELLASRARQSLVALRSNPESHSD